MNRHIRSSLLLAALLAACGGQGLTGGDGGACPPADAAVEDSGVFSDGGADAGSGDAGVPSRALAPRYPRVRSGGGRIQTAPRVRTYIAAGDPLKAALESFAGGILQSAWWTAATAEYCTAPGQCVGSGTFEGAFTLAAPASAAYSEDDVRAVIAADLANTATAEPDPQSVYLFFIPAGASFTSPFGDPACSGFHAFHYFLTLQSRAGTPVRIPYAVMLRCTDSSTLQLQTFLASHELVEAATDPFMDGFVVDDSGWALTHGAELADVCLYAGTTTSGSSDVERSYSDRRAAQGLDPCGLPSDGVDFNTVPASSQTRLVLRPGESTTVELVGESEAATDDWTLQATSLLPGLTVSLGSATANNGTKVTLTVSAAASLPPGYRGAFIIRSKKAGLTHAWQGAAAALYE